MVSQAKGIMDSLRKEFHANICKNILGYRVGSKVLNCSDKDNSKSVELADLILTHMELKPCPQPPKSWQTIGKIFTDLIKDYIDSAFSNLSHIRSGSWSYSVSQSGLGIAAYDQYGHLAQLQEVIHKQRELAAALGGDYLITPDIVVGRRPLSDNETNSQKNVVSKDGLSATLTSLRSNNTAKDTLLLHASLSCKWTTRSDRAQNTRTEALNLVRNRKGATPHKICAITMEPLPSRLASLALGTGDLDCTYHAALAELLKATDELGDDVQYEMLHTLVDGRRLRDISDLPFDLAQ